MEKDTASFVAHVRAGSKFIPQTRERAVRLLKEHVAEFRNERVAFKEIAAKFGMHKETLRRWVLEARAEAGVGGFNWSSQHPPDIGGVRRWRQQTGARGPEMCPRVRVGSGVLTGRYGR